MRSTGSESLVKLRGAWVLGLFTVGGVLIVAGVALVNVPASLIVAGLLILGVTAAEVF